MGPTRITAVKAIAPLAEEMKGVFSKGKGTEDINGMITNNLNKLLSEKSVGNG
jgi:hypothetical protein